MALQQYQCFRLKDVVYEVPTHYINDEPCVCLDDIRDKFGFDIKSFTFNGHPLAIVRNNNNERDTPLRIRAIIDKIIDCDEPEEILIGQAQLDKMDAKLDKIVEKSDGIHADVRKVLDNTEELKCKADAILRQTFQLAEFTVPRLFIIRPDDTKKFKLTNIVQHSYRLFFLCECENSEERHLAFHEGYEIKQPHEFIKKYGPYLKTMLKAMQCLIKVSGLVIPPLHKLSKHIHVPDFLKNPRFSSDLNDTLSEVGNMLGEFIAGDKGNLPTDVYLEGAELRQLETFLKNKDVHRTFGNLYRSTTKDGRVRWVCLYHYDKCYTDTKKKQFYKQFRAQGGTIQGDVAMIDNDCMKNFDPILTLIKEGLCVIKLTLHECTMRDSTLDKFLVSVNERPNIKCLELYSISVSYGLGFILTHRQIIEKLGKIKNKREDLTIKYIVEYPKSKSSLDLDLFDFAIERSTKTLLLDVYTHDDGKKIVLRDLNESDLHRMVKSLEQSKTITHCSIDKFNPDLSNMLLYHTTITHLTIAFVKFDVQKIADLQHLLSRKQNLRALRFITCENLSPLIMMLSQELVTNVNLEILALHDISDGKQVTELATMLKKNEHLIEFNLAFNININVQSLINISLALKANRTLKKLTLTGIQGGVVHQDSSINLYELFFRKTYIEQVTLNFHDQKSKISLFRKTIEDAENIQTLNLSNCNILSNKKSNGISPIIISNSLVSLSIYSCEFPFEDAIDLFQGLIQNKTLTTLVLGNLTIPYGTSYVTLSEELAKMLEQNTGLKNVTYSHVRLKDKAIMRIGEALKKNTTLEKLNISFNQISDDGAVELTDALRNNNTLLSLVIKGNNITNEGIKRVLQTLQSNLTLRHLNIFHQSNSKDDPVSFSKAMEEPLNINEFIHVC